MFCVLTGNRSPTLSIHWHDYDYCCCSYDQTNENGELDVQSVRFNSEGSVPRGGSATSPTLMLCVKSAERGLLRNNKEHSKHLLRVCFSAPNAVSVYSLQVASTN
jgi:hypothetical protein